MTVLVYHKFNSRLNFEKQIQYLIKSYTFSHKICSKKGQILITVDDGDPSFYYIAFPVLKKYKIPAILFVVTDLIDSRKPFWWDEVEYYLGKEKGYSKVWEIKTWPNKRREAYIEELRKNSNKALLEYSQLTKVQLQEMNEAGIVIANHSHTHPIFDQCTLEELENEMNISTNILKDLGFSPYVFAYPNGNYSLESEAIIKKYGVKKAYLFDHKINKGQINPLRISRLIVNDTTPLWKFKLIVSGWHSKILPFSRFIAKLTGRLKK